MYASTYTTIALCIVMSWRYPVGLAPAGDGDAARSARQLKPAPEEKARHFGQPVPEDLARAVMREVVESVEQHSLWTAAHLVGQLKVLGLTDETLTRVVSLLEHKSADVRRAAAKTIGEFGADARRAVPHLAGLMDDEDALVRETAAEALGSVGVSSPEVVKALIEALDDPEKDVREKAARALAGLQPPPKDATAALAQAMRQHPESRGPMVAALADVAAPAPGVVGALVDLLKGGEDGPPPRTREDAARALGHRGEAAAEAVPHLAALVADQGEDKDLRIEAANALGAIGPQAKSAADELSTMASEGDPLGRPSAVLALWRIERNTEDTLAALTDLTKHDSYRVRRRAALAIGKMGPAAAPAIPTLVDLMENMKPPSGAGVWMFFAESAGMKALASLGAPAVEVLTGRLTAPDADYRTRSLAATALGRIRPEGLDPLLEAIRSENPQIRQAAVGGLGETSSESPRVVRAVVQLLNDRSAKVREAAARELARLRPVTPATVRALVAAADDASPGVRRATVRTLDKLGPRNRAMVAKLVTAIRDDDAEVRTAAAEALKDLGPLLQMAVPQLVDALGHEDPPIREEAVHLLRRIEPPTARIAEALEAALDDTSPHVRLAAAWGLRGKVEAERLVEVSRTLLDADTKAELRIEALNLLATMGPSAEGALPAVKRLKADSNREVREAAYEVVKAVKGEVQGLVEALEDPDMYVRWEAARDLAEMGPKAAPAVPALAKMLNDRSGGYVQRADVLHYEVVCVEAAEALANVGPEVRQAVPALTEAIRPKDRRSDFMINALHALAAAGPDAEPAVPVLIEVLNRGEGSVAAGAAFALGEIGRAARPAVPTLVTALQESEDPDIRAEAAGTLGLVCAKDGEAHVIDPLTTALEDPAPDVRLAAAWSLIRLGRSEPTLPVLRSLVEHEDAFMRRKTLRQLGKLGKKAAPVLPIVRAALDDENLRVRHAAAETAWLIDNRAELAIPVLREVLEEQWRPEERADAAEILGKIGPPAKAAVPELENALEADSERLRDAARAALKKIQANPHDSTGSPPDSEGNPRDADEPAEPERSETALETLRNLANEGDAWAMFFLGRAHHFRKYFDPATEVTMPPTYPEEARKYWTLQKKVSSSRAFTADPKTGAKWLRRAAEKGNGQAIGAVGVCYLFGLGVEENPEKGVQWLKRAADRGVARAKRNLAVAYWRGLGTKQDRVKAVELFREAAKAGETTSMVFLGDYYFDGTEPLEQDRKKALDLWRRAASKHDDGAMKRLGQAYAEGAGVHKDLAEAAGWYRKAAEHGNSWSAIELGIMYQKGRGVQKDHKKAVELYRQAASFGDHWGMHNLGNAYRLGRGVPVDNEKALHWFRRAARKGNAAAMNNIGWMYSRGRGVKRDEQKAFEWYRKAADAGHAGGMYNVGYYYYGGYGVEKDQDKAIDWWHRAAEAGSSKAQQKLRSLGETE